MRCTTSARRTRHRGEAGDAGGRVTFRSVLAFQNFMLMMAVIFGLQFVDRSFGPVLPLYVEQVGVAHDRVALVSGMLFSIMACTGALGHHFCGKLLKRYPRPRRDRRRRGDRRRPASGLFGALGRRLGDVRGVAAARPRHRRGDDRQLTAPPAR